MKKNTKSWMMVGLMVLACGGAASASVIGYWRFENSSSLGTDSGPNELDLTVFGTPGSVTVASGTDPGANFPNPLPQNGLVNERGVELYGSWQDHFYLENSSDLSVSTQVTAELFFNQSTTPGSTPTGLVGHWRGDPNQRSWALGVNSNLNPIFGTSANGDARTIQGATSLDIALNTDYYLAAVYNAGSVTFYLKDLTDESNPLQTQTVTGYHTALHSANHRFYVGGVAWDTDAFVALNGVMDEARMSNTALDESQLLIIPEPGTLLLMGLGLGLALAFGRRRRV